MRYGRAGRRRKQKQRESEDVPVKILDDDVISLNKWAHDYGLQCDLLQCATFKGTGRGMLARRNIMKNAEIISVPKKLLITVDTVRSSCIGHLVVRLLHEFKQFGVHISLTMFLLHEKSLGIKSFWLPYLNTLPETFTTPAYLPDEQLTTLPVMLKDKVSEQIEILVAFYKAVHNIWMEEQGHCYSYEQFRWAWFAVNTRCVYLDSREKQMALIPVLDMLNHSAATEVQAGLYGDVYQIKIKQACRKGKQVFINYGPHDNIKLWMEYGFTIPSNPHAVAHLNLDLLSCTIPKQQEILKEQNLTTDLLLSTDGPCWKLLCCLRILCMDYDELLSWKCVLQGVPISERNEEKVISWIKRIVMKELALVDQALAEVRDQHVLHICKERKEIILYNMRQF
ncbi:SET domain-containing protein 4-like isoform X2 [Dysidea avara]|uniref:SET domain-containing protein 4-like isoform X2 n=1 Tax=Dysidea avara TaxID=196820 RepID=UPI003332EE5D